MNHSGVSTPVAAFRPGRGAVRHLRAMAASLACVTTAFGAHIASGGSAVPAIVIATFLVAGAIAWAVAGVRWTTLQLLGLLVLCQTGVHIVAMATSAHDASMGAAMLLTHAAATGVSLLALARGEAFVWAVAERIALRPLRLLMGGFTTPARCDTITSIPATRPRTVHAVRVSPVRGPPTGFSPAIASL